MRFTEYDAAARNTAVYPDQYRLIYPALGLTGEAGEVAEKVKKILRDHDGYVSTDTIEELAKELGDVLWYLSALATDLGINLEFVATKNVEKLADRQARNKIKGEGDNR